MNLTLQDLGDGEIELAAMIRGHIYVMRYRTWDEYITGLQGWVDNRNLDFGFMDACGVTYYLGKLTELQRCGKVN